MSDTAKKEPCVRMQFEIVRCATCPHKDDSIKRVTTLDCGEYRKWCEYIENLKQDQKKTT